MIKKKLIFLILGYFLIIGKFHAKEVVLDKASHYTSASPYHQSIQGHSQKKELAEWTIIVYMQADNNLSQMAHHNVNQMKAIPTNKNVNIIIQWDKPETNMTHRLKIEQGREIDVGSLHQEMGINPSKELADCVSWVKENFPAKRYLLDLWNHGSGILDIHRSWLRPLGGCETRMTDEVGMYRHTHHTEADKGDKGILYDSSDNTYLSSNQLSEVMTEIRSILGKKLDLLGMDACLMAMLEVGYSVKDSVETMVASENIEQGTGWDYTDVIAPLVEKDGKMEADELAKHIVKSYEKQYICKDQEFTQSAFRLDKMDTLKDQVNKLVIQLLAMHHMSPEITEKMLEETHKSTIKFKDHYVDLYDFCEIMLYLVDSYIPAYIKHSDSVFYKELVVQFVQLQNILIETRRAVEKAVIAKASGLSFPEAGGISVYFPYIWNTKLDAGYPSCIFAVNSAWMKLLKINKK